MESAYNWFGNYDRREGYGYFNCKLLEAMLNRGVKITPLCLEQLYEWPMQYFTAANVDVNRPVIYVHVPADPAQKQNIAPIFEKFPARINMVTMYEATSFPAHWGELLNLCERVIVPSKFCQEEFTIQLRSENQFVPVHLVPGGVDPKDFYPSTQVVNRPYAFMCLADRGNRKGWDLAWKAFSDEFGNNENVRLIIKCRSKNLKEATTFGTDARVSFWRTDSPAISEIYKAADCFVFPSRGEGYGLPPREAAACGVPVICSNATGLRDGIDNWAYPISGEYKPVAKEYLEGGGVWFIPNQQELQAKMRWCYENQKQAREFAQSAAKWLHTNCTWDHSAEKFETILNTCAI